MKKLIRGIVEFRQKALPSYREKFANLALGQAPDTLFIACSDSRVAANVFASTEPGDLFVIRNVGNMIPCCGVDGHSMADESEAAAIEFAINNLNVQHIIVCGHSECGAMHAILNGRNKVKTPHLRAWLRHGEMSLSLLDSVKGDISPVNKLSQLNVLQQVEHLKSYPIVEQRLEQGKLQLHAWWFELAGASVYAYDRDQSKFIMIDEKVANKILSQMDQTRS
jgi:carbonic anhydrase